MSEADRAANKAFVRQFYDALQARDLETSAELYLEDYTSGAYLASMANGTNTASRRRSRNAVSSSRPFLTWRTSSP